MEVLDAERMGIEEDISYYATDGRLTEAGDGKRFEWRKMIELSKKLGRPLTELESMNYQVKDITVTL